MQPPFEKVLIANRGEIAVRIMQTCREMGVRTVAVYSAADAAALHVTRADEAYCIGPAPALESYLRIDAVLEAAERSGAEAVHPGYGFLAENAAFALAVRGAGLAWIGPPAEVIARLGDKVAAKELAVSAGVPVVPGYAGPDQSIDRMLHEANAIGYPVMLKAAAGGGGKGMRVVENPDSLPAALEGARREAMSAFGDSTVFLEKLLVNPRHVEIQLLVDQMNNAVYLGERECSIQRRHQKVVEEAPSPVLTPDLRAQMGGAAVRLARAAGYVNAGTVEFLFSGDRFYFLEVNTRIQVEHPVTELVTGLDLVRQQLEIAAGRPLGFSQLDVELRGHAMEARLYAEDPAAGFLPATGKLEMFQSPMGPGVRNDVGVFEGMEITSYYDPILAKLIVHAGTRAEAVARLTQALDRYGVLGVTTNLGFLHWLVRQDAFVVGRIDTGYVDRTWTAEAALPVPPDVLIAAAAFELTAPASASEAANGLPYNPWSQASGWRSGGVGRTYSYALGDTVQHVFASRSGDGAWRMTVGDDTRLVLIETQGRGTLVLRSGASVETFMCARTQNGIAVLWHGQVYELRRSELRAAAGDSRHGAARTDPTAPMPGTVVRVIVEPGQRVGAHEPLLVMEAMKMEHVIEAPHDALVVEVLVREGDMVTAGSPVVRLDEV